MTEAKARERLFTTFGGKYKLRRVIGVGGMGAVYAAVHSFTGKHCAVKVLDPSISQIEGYAARFLREARVAAEIGHPAICDVYDAGHDHESGALYLVLELLEGQDLGAAIKRGDLTTDEIIEVGAQTLEGLAAAHGRSIVHRDVKPENVFLTRDEHGNLRVKLLDFGVAKSIRDTSEQQLYSTQQGQVVGTPYYMSPEQAGGKDVDRRADVWSTGAMLFHALTRRPPFRATNYNTLILKILGDERAPSVRDFRPDLPEWLVRVVDGALKKNVIERWQSAEQMAAGLRNRTEAPIGLEWEAHEDATLRTESPFAEKGESLSPPSLADALTPPKNPTPPAYTPPPHDANLAPTLAATPAANAAIATPSTPRTWERPAASGGKSRSGFWIGLGVGVAVAFLAAIGVTAWLLSKSLSPDPVPAGQPIELAVPDAGPDAAP